jgi:anthranilate phosphoribosyltransferase
MGENVDFMQVEDDGGVAAKNGFVKAWLRERREGESRDSSPAAKGREAS